VPHLPRSRTSFPYKKSAYGEVNSSIYYLESVFCEIVAAF